jgi:thioredoxin-like negative regulator of GroEL
MRAELEVRLGRDEAAFETLLDGRMCFAGTGERAEAIGLLLRAREIEPWDIDVALDLARLYSRTDRAGAALELLAPLAARVQGRGLRRVRALQWRITLSFRFAARWLQALQRECFEPELPSEGLPALDFDALERERPR